MNFSKKLGFGFTTGLIDTQPAIFRQSRENPLQTQ